MSKPMKHLTNLLLLLFLAPIIIATIQTPLLSNETEVPKEETISTPVAYAAQVQAKPTAAETQITEPKKAFVYFTHSHEAYPSVLEANNEKIAVYHTEQNIASYQDLISDQFAFHQLETTFLEVDNMKEMKANNKTFTQAYGAVRPFIIDALAHSEYDLVLDLHRDSAKSKITTLKSGDNSYAKLLFVIGGEHANYNSNQQLANNLSEQLNKLVPGISRGVIVKKGRGVDGVYNQDLSKNSLLVELGGIETTEEEINRTISVLAKAVSNLYTTQIPS